MRTTLSGLEGHLSGLDGKWKQVGVRSLTKVWGKRKSFVPWFGRLAVLCVMTASSTLAQFTNYVQHPWQGGTNHFYGSSLITSAGTIGNSTGLIYNSAALPADTGPLFGWSLTPGVTRSGDYYYGIGLLDEFGGGTNTINNNSGGIMQGIVTSIGQGFAAGVYAEAGAVTIKNAGLLDGEFWNNDGTAAAVYATGNVNFTNFPGATLSGTAPYFAAGIYTAGGGAQLIVNLAACRT
jgi:hypothetical protein